MKLAEALATAVGADHVEALPELAEPPCFRVVPGSAAEVAEVIHRAAALGAAIHPVGAGGRPSRVDRDPKGERSRVFISTRRLDQVLQLDEQSLLVHAQAGLTGLDLERILAPRGLSIGDYPPVVLTSSLGGIIAVRTPGKSSARHGFFEEAVVGVSAVLADGRTVHTRVAPRRSTGPDLARALCGSEGTIGFITSLVLRIHHKPEALLVAATAGPTDLAACDRDLITSAVIAEGGGEGEHGLAETWWRRLHAGEL